MSNHKNTLKTAFNDVTGDTINNSIKGSQEKFAQGWDAIFGKKKEPPTFTCTCLCGQITEVQGSTEWTCIGCGEKCGVFCGY